MRGKATSGYVLVCGSVASEKKKRKSVELDTTTEEVERERKEGAV